MELGTTTQPASAVISVEVADRALQIMRSGMSQAELLTACRQMNIAAAIMLIVGGVIFLLWGYFAFKWLVTLNAAVMGAWIGALVGSQAGGPLPAAIIGGFVCAVITWPLMKYAVAVMGGLIGTVIGMTLWRSAGLDPAFASAGGGMGLIFFGMLSFILFRTSVMMFTSLQGAIMLTVGAIGCLYKFNGLDATTLDNKLNFSPLLMPTAVFIAAVCGIIYQNTMREDSSEPEVAKA